MSYNYAQNDAAGAADDSYDPLHASIPGNSNWQQNSYQSYNSPPPPPPPPERRVKHTNSKDVAVDCPPALLEKRRVYIGSMPYYAQEQDIAQFFSAYQIEKIIMTRDPYTNRCPGYAFVDVVSAEEAQRAIREMHGRNLLERPVKVSLGILPKRAYSKASAEPVKSAVPSSGSNDGKRIVVGGLPQGLDPLTVQSHIRDQLSGFTIEAISAINEPQPGQSMGYHLYIDFSTHSDAALAASKLSNKPYLGSVLQASLANSLQSANDAESQLKEKARNALMNALSKAPPPGDSAESFLDGLLASAPSTSAAAADGAQDMPSASQLESLVKHIAAPSSNSLPAKPAEIPSSPPTEDRRIPPPRRDRSQSPPPKKARRERERRREPLPPQRFEGSRYNDRHYGPPPPLSPSMQRRDPYPPYPDAQRYPPVDPQRYPPQGMPRYPPPQDSQRYPPQDPSRFPHHQDVPRYPPPQDPSRYPPPYPPQYPPARPPFDYPPPPGQQAPYYEAPYPAPPSAPLQQPPYAQPHYSQQSPYPPQSQQQPPTQQYNQPQYAPSNFQPPPGSYAAPPGSYPAPPPGYQAIVVPGPLPGHMDRDYQPRRDYPERR